MSHSFPPGLLSNPLPLTIPPLFVRLLTIALWVGAGLLLLLIFILGLRWISQQRRRLGKQVFHLHFANQGNLNCHYALQAQEPVNVLRFQFLLNGIELPVFTPPVTQPTQATSVQPAAPIPQTAPSASARPARKPPSGFKKKSAQARKSAGTVASILSTLGSLLPGSAGRQAAQAGSKVRAGQMQASRAAQISSEASSLPGGKPSEITSASPQKSSPSTAAVHAQAATTASTYTVTPAPTAPTTQFPGKWVKTPFISPGDSILLDLHVIPNNPRRSQLYTFKVVSRCIEAYTGVGSGAVGLASEYAETGQMQMRGISWLGIYWPHLLWILVNIGIGVAVYGFLAIRFPLS
ncbi:MAG: hypothetical protein JW726_00865 [Anaerolineales bacterium]|nr:hypothetical protein [Anaerolineales bacterium]